MSLTKIPSSMTSFEGTTFNGEVRSYDSADQGNFVGGASGTANRIQICGASHPNTPNVITMDTNGSEKFRIDSSGNLGIGISPDSRLHVYKPNLGGMRIAFNGTSVNYFDGDTTYWRSGDSNTFKMTLDSSGNLLVGRTSAGVYASRISANVVAGNFSFFSTCDSTSTGVSHVGFANPNGLVGQIVTNASSTSYITSSDYRLKEDVQPVADAITRLNQLKPVNFAWKVDCSRCDGFLAHELQEVIPEAATGHKDEMRTEEYEVTPAIKDEEGNVITEAVMGEREVPVYQGIDQSKIVPLLTAALQEAVAKIESQAQTIESLTQRIEALEAR